MIVISRHVAIPDGEFEITAIRAQGAGGQHVNKTSTAIHLRFDIRASSLPEYYKERLLAASHHLISSDGVIVIKAQEYRSQELNREAALARLVAVIKDLTTEQKMKYEIAKELGLYEQVIEKGWQSLSAKQTGKIGGMMTRRKKELQAKEHHIDPSVSKEAIRTDVDGTNDVLKFEDSPKL